MKKIGSFAVILSIILLTSWGSESFASNTDDPEKTIEVDIHKDIYGYVLDGRTLIPLKEISQYIGAIAHYDHETKVISIVLNEIKLELAIGSSTMKVNGIESSLLTEPIIIRNQAYIPVRDVFETFHVPIEYHHEKRTVTLELDGTNKLTIHLKPIENAYLYQPEKIDALMFHAFSETKSDSLHIEVAQFEQHLQALKKNGYETITDADLLEYKNNPNAFLPKKPLLITIDDGYKDNYTYAFPLLRDYGMRATVYIIVERRDNIETYPHHFTWAEAKEMLQSGVINIQSHTYKSHHYIVDQNNALGASLVTKIPGESFEDYSLRVREDLLFSKNRIEEMLESDVYTISFPYGSYNDTVLKIAEEVGYELFITTHKNTNTRQSLEDGLINRINVHGNYSSDDLLVLLDSF